MIDGYLVRLDKLGVTAGYIPLTGGDILVDGKNIVRVPPFQRNIGMVFIELMRCSRT